MAPQDYPNALQMFTLWQKNQQLSNTMEIFFLANGYWILSGEVLIENLKDFDDNGKTPSDIFCFCQKPQPKCFVENVLNCL